MATAEFPEPEVGFKCDKCGKLFDSPADAHNHSEKAHIKSSQDDFRSWISGTSTPAEDREEERARTPGDR